MQQDNKSLRQKKDRPQSEEGTGQNAFYYESAGIAHYCGPTTIAKMTVGAHETVPDLRNPATCRSTIIARYGLHFACFHSPQA